MGIGRVTLIVFSIASILVLAGFSTILNEKAYAGGGPAQVPPFGDFKCWEVLPESGLPAPPALLSIQDQFGTIENSDWTQVGYCAAAEKFGPGSSPFSFTFPPLAQHYQGWFYPPQFRGPGTGETVIITVEQFEQIFTTRLGDLDSILVPATKFTSRFGQVDSFNMDQHWNCYLIEQQPDLNQIVDLVTQHGPQNAVVLDPFLLCAPMIKTDLFPPGDVFGTLFDEHLLCYDLRVNNPGVDLPFLLLDQLTPEPFPIAIPGGEELLCVPALKSFAVVGGTLIPLDTTALLLAGVQSISMWMIPVIAAGVVIGVFVIKRRK